MPPRKKSKPNLVPKAEAATEAQTEVQTRAGPTGLTSPEASLRDSEQSAPTEKTNGTDATENAQDGISTVRT